MYRQLTREQRYAIYPGKQEGKTQSAIARQIGVNRSTVSREIRRNSNRHGRYWWSIAHERPREAVGGRRQEVRGLGDGHDSRERTEERDIDPVRAEQELPDNGEASARHGSREGRGCRHQAALSVQEERADDNLGHVFEFLSVQLKLNRRPREKLNFSTPKDEFFRLLL